MTITAGAECLAVLTMVATLGLAPSAHAQESKEPKPPKTVEIAAPRLRSDTIRMPITPVLSNVAQAGGSRGGVAAPLSRRPPTRRLMIPRNGLVTADSLHAACIVAAADTVKARYAVMKAFCTLGAPVRADDGARISWDSITVPTKAQVARVFTDADSIQRYLAAEAGRVAAFAAAVRSFKAGQMPRADIQGLLSELQGVEVSPPPTGHKSVGTEKVVADILREREEALRADSARGMPTVKALNTSTVAHADATAGSAMAAAAVMPFAAAQTNLFVGGTQFLVSQAGAVLTHATVARFGNRLCDARVGYPRPKGSPNSADTTDYWYLHQYLSSTCNLLFGAVNPETNQYASTATVIVPSWGALQDAIRRDLRALPDTVISVLTARGAAFVANADKNDSLRATAQRLQLLVGAAVFARTYQQNRVMRPALLAAVDRMAYMAGAEQAKLLDWEKYPLVRDALGGLALVSAAEADMLSRATRDTAGYAGSWEDVPSRPASADSATLLGLKTLLVNARASGACALSVGPTPDSTPGGTPYDGVFVALRSRFADVTKTACTAPTPIPVMDAAEMWRIAHPVVRRLAAAQYEVNGAVAAANRVSTGDRARLMASAYAEAAVALLPVLLEGAADDANVGEPELTRALQVLNQWSRVPAAQASERYGELLVDLSTLALTIGGPSFRHQTIPAQFMKQLLFANDIIVAKTPDDVEIALKRVVEPADAYTRKRLEGADAPVRWITLQAYVGGGVAAEGVHRSGWRWGHWAPGVGPAIPVGFEIGWSVGQEKKAWALFAQLLDVGQVAAWRLGSKDTVDAAPPPFRAEHLFAPGLSVMRHPKLFPISFGAGVVYAPRFREVVAQQDASETSAPARASAVRLQILAGVDIPLLFR